jgi:hypothetical protein
LRLTLFITGDVLVTPRGEFGEFFPARHGEVLPEARRVSNAELSKAVKETVKDFPFALPDHWQIASLGLPMTLRSASGNLPATERAKNFTV